MNSEKTIDYLKAYEKPIKIMEVCGTHTESIAKNGIRDIISPAIRLVSGPGCPVCVTVPGYIDKLIDFSFQQNCCVLSFGDLFKVKGSQYNFSEAKSMGANINIIYSPLEAVCLAEKHQNINYVLAAVGFETTIPIYAVLLDEVIRKDIKNIKLLTSLKATIPAISHICEQEQIDGFICPGHVSVITGSRIYTELSDQYHKPFVITGFEAEHILASIYSIAYQLGHNQHGVVNQYKSVVSERGNRKAINLINKYFAISNTCSAWRGIGEIANSSYILRKEYEIFDLGSNDIANDYEQNGCRCGDVMLGRITPAECPLFGEPCRPDNAVGACMVSSEGACGIWYNIVTASSV